MSHPSEFQPLVEQAFLDRSLLASPDHVRAVEGTLAALDRGELRVATPPREDGGAWITHTWVKEAILLYFALRKIETFASDGIEFHDKIPVKRGLAEAGVRVVPPGVARYGSHPRARRGSHAGYVNIGARVGAGTMVDTWATVGSCAQIGRDCHLAGGVGIGGVLEPPERAARHHRRRRLRRIARRRRRGDARRARGGALARASCSRRRRPFST